MQIRKPGAGQSLTTMLAIAIFALSAAVLLISSVLQLFFNIQTQQETMANRQQLIAQDAAKTVSSFIQEKFGVLDTTASLANPVTTSPEMQKQILDSLLGLQPALRQVVLLNAQDQTLAKASRISKAASGQFADRLKGEVLAQLQQRQRYISPVYIDEVTSEPMMIIAVPVTSALGDFQGMLVAEVNLKFMWNLVDQLKVGETGWAYVVDRQGTLIAFKETDRVLKDESVNHLQVVSEFIQNPVTVRKTGVSMYQGITAATVVGTYVPLETPDWAVVTELPWQEAYREIIWEGVFSIGITLVMAVSTGLLGVFLARRLAVPLVNLTQTATRIAGGEMDLQAEASGPQEVVSLAAAFNSMTAQLRELIGSLEQRVADRTHRLGIVATLGEHLNAILDPSDLLREVVNQVKENFGYYHAHIYLMDGSSEKLVVAAGTGQAGQEMVAKGHSIPVNNAQSLVAQVARTGKIVTVGNVHEAEEWLPNALLPETQAEIAVPLVQEDKVIGVLDVQADRVGALDENDANLLRSLASQVAVALSNARLFEQTNWSKEEAEQARQEAERAREEAEQARQAIETVNKTLEVQMWQTAGLAQLNDRMRGEQDTSTLASSIIQQLCQYLNAQVGTLYVREEHTLRLAGSYAYTPPRHQADQFRLGESLIGQAALEKRPIVVNTPDDHLTITSSLSQTQPRQVLIAPFIYDGQVAGVVELGSLTEFSPIQIEFLHQALGNMAIAFVTAQARHRVNELLAETQQQAEELQAQEEELRAANEELESQTESLRTSEAKLKTKQAELEEVNTELEEKAEALQKNSAMLHEQRTALDRQNQELKAAQQALEQKAEELALASKYKSEFLANMSHELRTPLNSLLILAGMLAKNEDGNLTPDQVESIQIIHNGGTDLLNLINEILDLSKVEAGKMEFHFELMPLERLLTTMRAQFTPVAEGKGLVFETSLAEGLPETIETDQQRVEQIIKNLLSNAFKFTAQGQVRLTVSRPEPEIDLSKGSLDPARVIAFSVSDTGIGMTPDQQKIVFEAFQQADGSTSRQYGGTGLGLTISRELATKLGGQMGLVSQKGQGSTFTLYLPLERAGSQILQQQPAVKASSNGGHKVRTKTLPSAQPAPAAAPSLPAAASLADDRAVWQAGDRLLLIIEDDPKFARIAYDYAHQKNFKCLVAGDGETGLQLAQTYPVDAIILDLTLPGISGWEVLDTLKQNSNTRHIPVHIISAADEDLDAYKRGAMGFLTKPVSPATLEESFQRIERFITRQIKSLLLVEDDDNLRLSVRKLLEGNDVQISEASLGQAALEQLASQHFDCMILDLSLPDMSGFELLNRLDGDESLSKCPVIVYTGRALSEEENQELLKYADSVIVKGVKSPERLLDETALFLHRVIANMSEDKQQTIKQLHNYEGVLAGKQILIVDDDARNAFALSKLLTAKGLNVYIAPSGPKALELLDKVAIDLVLMDIMMPGMDGYETTRQVRVQERFRRLPILALTAKAMQGDREKCLAAGANDYLSKPVDPDRLFSMLRVWLSQE
ncbi:MAG: response regulator [Anaerolineae bacterium]|nr:response regulator [Anaerolineae bacterium]